MGFDSDWVKGRKCPECGGELEEILCEFCKIAQLHETREEVDVVARQKRVGCSRPPRAEVFYHIRCKNNPDHKWEERHLVRSSSDTKF